MSVGSITTHSPETIHPDDDVREGANRMRRTSVGALMVVDDQQKPVGVVTDRDLVLRALSLEKDPRSIKIASVMTANPTVILASASIGDAVTLMRHGGFRRLPVVDGAGVLVGVVSFDDVMELLAKEISAVGQLLEGQKKIRD